MKTFVKIVSIFTLSVLLLSNDTIINGSGGTLYPMLETDIEIEKEILKLTLKKNMHVDVYFEFMNPVDEKELTVGFVIPPIDSPEYTDEEEGFQIEKRKPVIEDFTVEINGKTVPHEVGILKDTPFEQVKKIEGEWNYAYYFKATFQKGLNIVKHTYSFDGGWSSIGDSHYSYVLKTGKNWSKGRIKDFTLQIDMGDDIEFSMHNQISSNDDYNIIGKGKRSDDKLYMRDGYIELKKKDFVPLDDIFIYVPPRVNYYDPESLGHQAELADLEDLEQLDKKRLRLIRNYFFARKGYKFKSKDLRGFFSKFFWYMPDDDLTNDDIYDSFDEATKNKIDSIKELENKL